jgi:hypothetical protein
MCFSFQNDAGQAANQKRKKFKFKFKNYCLQGQGSCCPLFQAIQYISQLRGKKTKGKRKTKILLIYRVSTEGQQNGNSISLPSLLYCFIPTLYLPFQDPTLQPHILPTRLLNDFQIIKVSQQNHSFWKQRK